MFARVFEVGEQTKKWDVLRREKDIPINGFLWFFIDNKISHNCQGEALPWRPFYLKKVLLFDMVLCFRYNCPLVMALSGCTQIFSCNSSGAVVYNAPCAGVAQ